MMDPQQAFGYAWPLVAWYLGIFIGKIITKRAKVARARA